MFWEEGNWEKRTNAAPKLNEEKRVERRVSLGRGVWRRSSVGAYLVDSPGNPLQLAVLNWAR